MSEKKAGNEKDRKRLSHGSYSILITALVIAGTVICNLVISSLPSQATQFDFSSAKLYTLTDTSRNFLGKLSKEVTLYYICEGGKEDDTISKLLERYEDQSGYITVEQIDPALYPGFTSQYTSESVENNSVIAVCGENSRIVRAEDMYVLGYNYQKGGYVKNAFDGEGRVTSAIDYVISDDKQVLYALNGNGEAELGESFRDAVEKNNIDIKPLNLISEEEVPEDANAIIINAPAKDYSREQAEAVIAYLEKGGKAVIFSNYTEQKMPNFDAILQNYGVEREQGIILEGDSGKYMSYQYCLIPTVDYSEITSDIYENTYLLAPMSQGIKELETHRSTISMQPLLTTSNAAYSKVNVQGMTTSEKEAGDVDGPFHIGMLIQEDINNDKQAETEIVYYTTGYLLDEDYNRSVSGGNAQLFGGTAAYLCNGKEESSAVPVKSLQVPYLTLTDFTANFWTIICVFVLPLVFITAGAVMWLKRRKR